MKIIPDCKHDLRSMTFHCRLAAVLLLAMLSAHSAHGDIIVDTGEPVGSNGFYLGLHQDQITFQWLAGEFTLTQDWLITDVEGFIQDHLLNNSGSLSAVIYSNGSNNLPGTILYSDSFTVNDTGGFPIDHWYGVHGVNWNLTAGNYWVAFETHDGQTYGGGMPYQPPHPLANYAIQNSGTGGYLPLGNDAGLGVRISAVPTPIPGAWFLLMSGMIGLYFQKRRHSHKTEH